MKLNRGIKLLIGIVTALTWIMPLVVAMLWFLTFVGLFLLTVIACPSSGSCNPPPALGLLFPVLWFAFIFVIMLMSLLSIVLRVFYHIHITLNKTASDMFRVFTTIGMIFVPFIVEPLYFYACIWCDEPPEWARPTII